MKRDPELDVWRAQMCDGYSRMAGEVRGAVVAYEQDGQVRTYTQAHLAARWYLGLVKPAPVACKTCGVLDTKLPYRLIAGMHAALNWPEAPLARLRTDYAGRVFSTAPDLDYIALCHHCHKVLDTGWAMGQIRAALEAA
jgi:hypothetical protein